MVTTGPGGLSPRVRGNQSYAGFGVGHFRSIPASAGEPELRRFWGRSFPVYPRECGGTKWKANVYRYWTGLSPRVRGNQSYAGFGVGHFRSIPASAGEPELRRFWGRSFPVYPRECGGTKWKANVYRYWTGLSPRVRGNQSYAGFGVGHFRSIPASAGEPSGRPTYTAIGPVYPRECGGTVYIRAVPAISQGLSPRVRGNHRLVKRLAFLQRSIPASAGEPLNKLRQSL